MTKDTIIFWFRRDLRLADNEALISAAKEGAILPVYILDKREEFKIGGASQWWLHHALDTLNKSLDGKLLFFTDNTATLIPRLAKAAGAKAVYWNKVYEPAFLESDKTIEKALEKENITSCQYDGTMLWPVGAITKKDGTPFKIYKPFLRTALHADEPHEPKAKPKGISYATGNIKGAVALEKLALLPKIHWDEGIKKAWKPGEEEAQKMLKSFVATKLKRYGAERNYPAHDVLSRLSPYLHYGEVSPNQIWHAVHKGNSSKENLEKFISELSWRDFAYNLLTYFPDTPTESYNARLKRLEWRHDEKALKAWQQGQTGIPIVDAGMRQLWQTGYMHNRVRMITASFLIKNLLTDWRIGADWFLDTLVDADLAVNTLNWQWVAGTGLDAAPFFRVFNPLLQSKNYDKDGEYIKTYVPELKGLPAKHIHAPWLAPPDVLAKAKVDLGKTYPKPYVDLKASSTAALDAYYKTANG